MKNLLALITCMIFGLSISMAQSSPTDLTAEEIFEKVINYYDPDGVWDNYEGSMHMYSIHDEFITD